MGVGESDRGKLAGRVGAICFWVALWAVLAAFVGNDILLAGPLATIEAFGSLLASPAFWAAVGVSGARIVGSSIASSLAGIVLGLAAARFRVLETLLEIPIHVMKSAPVACVVVVLLVAFGSAGAIVAIVAFVALPPFYLAAFEASRARREDEARILKLMGLSAPGVFFACTWPLILPLFRHASKTAVGLSWRAGITGELLSVPMHSMGAAIYVSKLTLDTPALLAWTIVVMLLAFACEFIVLRVLDFTKASPKLALRLGRAKKTKAQPALPSCLSATDVCMGYDGKPVLENVTVRIGNAERLCLMAPTGSGKTTLLNIMLGFELPASGKVEHPALCGVVLQASALAACLSAWENVALVASFSRSDSDMKAQLEELLPAGCMDKPAANLSGGTRRLVEIARAIFSPGTCIVLDEPFSGLDPETKERACAFITANLDNRPLIIATHDQTDASLLGASILKI